MTKRVQISAASSYPSLNMFVQGEILGRNSAGLIMNEGNLIIQQVSKDSAGDQSYYDDDYNGPDNYDDD